MSARRSQLDEEPLRQGLQAPAVSRKGHLASPGSEQGSGNEVTLTDSDSKDDEVLAAQYTRSVG